MHNYIPNKNWLDRKNLNKKLVKYKNITIKHNVLFNTVVSIIIALFIMSFILYIVGNKHKVDVTKTYNYGRWDSRHYHNIAKHGYKSSAKIHHILTHEPSKMRFSYWGIPKKFNKGICKYLNRWWCAHPNTTYKSMLINTHWFPFYPLLAKVINTLFNLSLFNSLFFISNIFFIFNIILIAYFYYEYQKRPPPFLIILSSCCFFGSIYYHAMFPISLTVFCTLLYLISLLKNKYNTAVIFGTLAGFSYPPMLALSFVAALFMLMERKSIMSFCLQDVLIISAPFIGFACAAAYIGISVGYWDAFFLHDNTYRQGYSNPLSVLYSKLYQLISGTISKKNYYYSILQTSIIFIYLITIICNVSFENFRKKADPITKLLIIFTVIFYFFPLLFSPHFTLLSSFRWESLLLPSVLLMSHFSKRTQALFTILMLYLFYHSSILFFYGKIM